MNSSRSLSRKERLGFISPRDATNRAFIQPTVGIRVSWGVGGAEGGVGGGRAIITAQNQFTCV